MVDGKSDESKDQQNEVPDADSNEEEKISDVCRTDGKEKTSVHARETQENNDGIK